MLKHNGVNFHSELLLVKKALPVAFIAQQSEELEHNEGQKQLVINIIKFCKHMVK